MDCPDVSSLCHEQAVWCWQAQQTIVCSPGPMVSMPLAPTLRGLYSNQLRRRIITDPDCEFDVACIIACW